MKRLVVLCMLIGILSGCHKKAVIIDEGDNNFSPTAQRLLILDELNREDFESEITYSLGDPIIFLSGATNDALWQVTLTSYEIVTDIYDASKKALVFHYNYRYFLQDFIMAQPVNSVVSPTVFYDETALKQQSLSEATVAYSQGNYEQSAHILYEPVVNDEVICKFVQLKPNTDQSCFSYYSYAGDGDYLVSFENNDGEHFNYLIDVTE